MSSQFAHGFEPTPDPRDDCGLDGKLPPLPIENRLHYDRDYDLKALLVRKQDVHLSVLDIDAGQALSVVTFVFMAALNRAEIESLMQELERFEEGRSA